MFVLELQSGLTTEIQNSHDQKLKIYRFDKMVVAAGKPTFSSVLRHRVRGQRQNRILAPPGTQLPRRIVAVDDRRLNIHLDQIESTITELDDVATGYTYYNGHISY